MKTSLVIINYNDYEMTKRLLLNVKDYKILEKIVIVDNHSTDNSYEKLKKFENKKIDVIKNYESRNFASGLTMGAKYVIKKLGKCNIIFSNADIIIKNEQDIYMLSSNINEDIGIVGPVISQHGEINRGWKISTPFQEILYNLPFVSRYFKKKFLYYNNQHYLKDLVEVDVVSGCFFVVSSDLLEKINYFDENTFLYYEENILAKRVEKVGMKIVIDNRVTIIHDHSITIDKSFKRIDKYKILKNSQRYFVKKYLDANSFELLLLFITNKFSLFLLYIRCFIGGFRK